jgi:anti-anti-sigma factor
MINVEAAVGIVGTSAGETCAAALGSHAARIEFVDEAVVVALAGEHDVRTITVVEDAFAIAEAARPRLVVVDLGACRSLDSAVVRALLLARERAQAAQRRIVLVVAGGDGDPVVVTMLRVSGIDTVFEILRTRDEALGHDASRAAARGADRRAPHRRR